MDANLFGMSVGNWVVFLNYLESKSGYRNLEWINSRSANRIKSTSAAILIRYWAMLLYKREGTFKKNFDLELFNSF